MTEHRKLTDLVSVGPAIERDLNKLGIHRVSQLVDQDAKRLCAQLGKITGQRVDPCVEDTFRAAIEQARDPDLPPEKCHWPYWSKVRKAQEDRK